MGGRREEERNQGTRMSITGVFLLANKCYAMLESLLLSMLLPLQQPYGHATVCVGHLIYDTFSLNLWYSLAWTLLLI